MPMWEWMSGWGWLGMAVMLLTLLVLVVVAVVVVMRLLGARDEPGADGRPAERSALEILRERFARGEIDEEEFQRTVPTRT
jgi:putative membrane protein